MLLDLKAQIVYGPVNSRRLGRSLGINALPPDRKVCLFNCVYCQYGWTHERDVRAGCARLPTAEQILDAVAAALENLKPAPAYLTFSGNGEATMHPQFPELVRGVNRLRDRFCPGARTAILSSSATVSRPSVRAALTELDVRIMKLDAGSPDLFRDYNGAAKSVDFEAVLDGLANLPDIVVQTLFTGGRRGNATRDNVDRWIQHLARIAPREVQLHSLDRGYPASSVLRAPPPPVCGRTPFASGG